jgi:hypothetical protein
MKTLLTNSYIKHFDFNNIKYREGYDNHFQGVIDEDGTVVGSCVNSYGNPSSLNGKIYRLWRFRFLVGRATGYPDFPNGAPYYKFAFVRNNKTYGILMGQRGIVYISLTRTKI